MQHAFLPPTSGAAACAVQPIHFKAVSWPRMAGWGLRALAVAALALVLGLAGCSRKEPLPEPVRSVKLLTVGRQAVTAERDYAGEVRARVESRLSFRVAGKLARRPVELGQQVRAGQLLAELDASDYELAAQAARAQVAAAQTQRDLVVADYDRFARLRSQGFISGAELDRRDAAVKSAQAQLRQAQAQAAAQGNQTGYARLLADAAGVVTSVDAEPGQVVAAGTPVVRLARDGARDAVFSVPEDVLASVRVGQGVQVQGWAGGESLAARVREVAASADPVTRTFLVKVALDEAAQAPPLGSTVQVRLAQGGASGPAQAIHLPTSALRQEEGGTAVWVYEAASGTVRLQPVQIAGVDGNQVMVSAGLTPGMQVVAAGVHVLAPGQRVNVYQPKGAQAQAGRAPAAMDSEAPAGPGLAASR